MKTQTELQTLTRLRRKARVSVNPAFGWTDAFPGCCGVSQWKTPMNVPKELASRLQTPFLLSPYAREGV